MKSMENFINISMSSDISFKNNFRGWIPRISIFRCNGEKKSQQAERW